MDAFIAVIVSLQVYKLRVIGGWMNSVLSSWALSENIVLSCALSHWQINVGQINGCSWDHICRLLLLKRDVYRICGLI